MNESWNKYKVFSENQQWFIKGFKINFCFVQRKQYQVSPLSFPRFFFFLHFNFEDLSSQFLCLCGRQALKLYYSFKRYKEKREKNKKGRNKEEWKRQKYEHVKINKAKNRKIKWEVETEWNPACLSEKERRMKKETEIY